MEHKYGRLLTAIIVGAICFPLGAGIGVYGGMYYAKYQEQAEQKQRQQRLKDLMEEADAATKKSDIKEAMSLYRKILMMEPSRPDIFAEAEHKLRFGKQVQKRIEETSKREQDALDSDSVESSPTQ